MNKEAIQKYFKDSALPQTVQDYLLGVEGVAEDFNFDEALKAHKAERLQFFKDKHSKSIIDAHEDATKEGRYLDIIKPIQRRLIKAGEFTEQEIEGQDVKGLIDLFAKKQKGMVEDAAKASGDECQQKATEYQEKYLGEKQQREALEQSYDAAINTAKADAAREKENYIINDKYNRLINGGGFDFIVDSNEAADLIRLRFTQKGYALGLNEKQELTVLAADGGVPIDVSGNGKYEDPARMIKEIAALSKLNRLSNGGEQNTPIQPDQVNVSGKTVSTKGVSFLQQNMA